MRRRIKTAHNDRWIEPLRNMGLFFLRLKTNVFFLCIRRTIKWRDRDRDAEREKKNTSFYTSSKNQEETRFRRVRDKYDQK